MTYRTLKLSEKYNKPEGVGLTLNKISLLEDNKMATRSNVFCRQHHSVDVLKKQQHLFQFLSIIV